MPRRVRPVSHEDQLTLVEHLDELRSRLIVCILVFGVALALCFWQNNLLLEIASHPLPEGHKRLITFRVTARIASGSWKMTAPASSVIEKKL